MKNCRLAVTAGLTLPLLFVGAATAQPNGAVEDFNATSENWFNAFGSAPIGWNASGSFDGGAYATSTFNFMSSADGDGPAIFRAQDEWNSSNGIFEGNYLTAGVTQLSFWVRHDAPTPLTVFARFSGPLNFPGANFINPGPIFTNTWTEVIIPIDESNPLLFLEGQPLSAVLADVGHLQIGVSVDAAIAGFDQDITFDLDNVRLTPAPGAGALLMGACLFSSRRRRS